MVNNDFYILGMFFRKKFVLLKLFLMDNKVEFLILILKSFELKLINGNFMIIKWRLFIMYRYRKKVLWLKK